MQQPRKLESNRNTTMRYILILLIASTLFATENKKKPIVSCAKLLGYAISDYNNARYTNGGTKKERRVLKTMYAARSIAGSNLYDICININIDDDIDDLKDELRKIK